MAFMAPWTWGTVPIKSNGKFIEEGLDQAWRSMLEFYVGDGDGVQMGEAPFEYVTEGRQSENAARIAKGSTEKPYSCCSDLCQQVGWGLIGGDQDRPDAVVALAKPVINLKEAWGWTVGVSVSRLRYKTGNHFHVLKKNEEWSPPRRSFFLIGENGNEHVAVFDKIEDDLLISYDYGQFWSRNKAPANYGGCKRTRRLVRGKDGRLYAGEGAAARPVIGHLDVDSWIAMVLASQPDVMARVP